MTLLHLDPLPRRTTKGEILNLLCTAGGLRREQVGRIDLHGVSVAIEVPDATSPDPNRLNVRRTNDENHATTTVDRYGNPQMGRPA